MHTGVSDPHPLVERDAELGQLHAALARVRAGRGELALVTGEAGSGKTTLIREFVRQAAGRPDVLWGACDPLSAPRPFGPLIDAVGSVDPDAAQRLTAGATRSESLAEALALVDGSRTNASIVFVVEDAHWADEGTLDMLTFLGRRISAIPSLIVVSYRDDEVGAQHPLRLRLGELSSTIRCRVTLPQLTVQAVSHLARDTDFDPIELHRATHGNAFFVTEIINSRSETLPESIRDAVMARASRLPELARRPLDAASIVPGRVEPWLLAAIATDTPSDGADVDLDLDLERGIDECVDRGLLHYDASGALEFNHELARLAIAGALSPARARAYHGRALSALERAGDFAADPARLAFHAAEAGDADAVIRYAPVAAEHAGAVGAHQEACVHLANALAQRARMSAADRARLHGLHGAELVMLGRTQEAVDAYDAAIAIHAANADPESEAWALVMTDRPLVLAGRQLEADARIDRAQALLENRPPSRAAAMLATCQSATNMLARRFEVSERYGQQAIALAELVGAPDIRAEASIQSGIGLAMSGDDRGLERIRQGIEIAIGTGNDYLVALGYSQIGSGYGELRVYDVAVPALRDGVAFGDAREFGSTYYMRAWLGRCELELGHWETAGALAGELVRNPRCVGISRFVALVTLAWLRGRRGDPDVKPLIDEALELARSTRHLQRLWPIAACRAELAWIADQLDDELELVEQAAAVADELDYQPAIEELSHWLHLGDGRARGAVDRARTAFGLSAAGRPDLAAARWREMGCPYEEAMALFLAGESGDLRAAHNTFTELGAAPMRTRTATALRATGQRVGRGPTTATRGAIRAH